MNASNSSMINFYQSQSKYSDPGCYTYLLASLPKSLGSIKQIIQGLLFHFLDVMYHPTKVPNTRLAEIELRYVENMLHQIIRLSSQSLLNSRKLQNKLLASCRDYSLLACAILRNQGVPARLRVVFNTYSYTHIFHDQVILEYWNAQQNAWHSVDMRMTPSYVKRLGVDLDINYFNVSVDQYIPAATAWCLIRKNPDYAKHFGDNQGNHGLWYVRDRMLQDLAAFNKVEMLIWDCWGMMYKKEHDMTEEELCLLDDVAKMLTDSDNYFAQLLMLYSTNSEFKVSDQVLNISPVWGKRMLDILI